MLTKQIVVLILLSGLFLLPACTETPTDREVQYLDTLDVRIKGNNKALNIDTDELVNRKKMIREKWMIHARDTAPEFKDKLLDDLSGMITAYDLFLNSYILLQSSNDLLAYDVEELRIASREKKCTRAEFKEQYAAIEKEIATIEKELQRVAQPVYDLEPMYTRLAVRWGVR